MGVHSDHAPGPASGITRFAGQAVIKGLLRHIHPCAKVVCQRGLLQEGLARSSCPAMQSAIPSVFQISGFPGSSSAARRRWITPASGCFNRVARMRPSWK